MQICNTDQVIMKYTLKAEAEQLGSQIHNYKPQTKPLNKHKHQISSQLLQHQASQKFCDA